MSKHIATKAKRRDRMQEYVQNMIDKRFAEELLLNLCILVITYIIVIIKSRGWL